MPCSNCLHFLLIPVVIFCSSTFGFAQEPVEGKILSAATHQPVSYASVSFLHGTRGTNADENGSFTLQRLAGKTYDSLLVSCVGFSDTIFCLKNADAGNSFYLHEHISLLDPMVLESKAYARETKLARIRSSNFSRAGDAGSEIAQRLYAPFPNCRVSRLRIGLGGLEFHDRIFEVRFYAVDSITGKPGTMLCDKPILLHTRGKSKPLLDLNEYRIVLPQGPFFISFGWLDIEQNRKPTTYTMEGSKEKHHIIEIRPFFETKEIPAYGIFQKSPTELYFRSVGQQWFPEFPFKKNNSSINMSLSFRY